MPTKYPVGCQCGRSLSYPVCDGSHGRPAPEPITTEQSSDPDPKASGSWKR